MTEMTIASLVLLLFACCWPTGEAAAKTYNARTFPSPMLKPTECGMGNNKSFVCDPDYILHRLQATQLNDLIRSKTKSFRCTCKDDCTDYSDKYAMMVAIVTRVDVAQNASMEERKLAVDQFAKDLQERGWAGGNCQNDIVIVLCKEYKMIVTSVGRETNKVLTDSCTSTVTNGVVGLLEQDRHFAVVQELIFKYSKYLNLTFCAADDTLSRDQERHPVILYVILAVLGAIGLTIGVWFIRVCFNTNWKKKWRLRHERSDRHESTGTELITMNSPKVGSEGNVDTENQQCNGGDSANNGDKGDAESSPRAAISQSSPIAGTSKSSPRAATSQSSPIAGTSKSSPRAATSQSSPRAGTSKSPPRTRASDGGACGYTPRGKFSSLRDGRPHLYLDLSKCKALDRDDDDNDSQVANEKESFLKTQA
ncbi:uncharacterized protein LOC135483396 isoform X1 [Lineus longissimus]|uniref:uncharacterized protein LOC135483396 isoform X1 n=1 Tax=Lineus longissimus TaxID=88925 RepID=UPI00315C8F14